MNSIEVRGAVKSYDGKNFILNGLNLTVQAGSIYGLIGASGCGKTTLLSCILGMKQLDAGTINVFGQKVSHAKTSKFTNLIGYMPQETSLVPELTIKETVHYFGNIFQMNAAILRKRFVMISDLLELKNVNKRIEQLSGGEKRRVSLAAVIIHDPQILILDEPTVGLDSILRNKIWTFLIDTTKSTNVSVIITTHYIAEAEKSDRCGLMRNGILLAEESPHDVCKRIGVSNLDEAFLCLCISKESMKSDSCKTTMISSGESSKHSIEMDNLELNSPVVDENKNVTFDERKRFCKQTMKALLKKEFIRIQRQPAEILFIFIFPIVQIFCFAFAVGRNPMGLKIGVVNYEISNNSFCSNYLKSTNYAFTGNSCYFENLSCYFLDEIQEKTAIKVYYDSFEEAFGDAKVGKIAGVLTIKSNFTDAISARKIDWQSLNENSVDAEQINIYLDQTNMIVTSFFHIGLFESFNRFNKKVLRHCNLDEALERFPLQIDTYYGTFEDDYIMTLTPGLFAQVVLLGSILFSISSISQSRAEGIWNRTLLAGVTTSEILLVHIIICIIIDVVEIVVLKIASMLLFDVTFVGSQWLIGLFCLVLSIVGSIIGLFISIMTKNVLIVNSAAVVLFFTCANLCGAFWPIEAQHISIRCISYLLPTTIPSISIKNIIVKGFGFSHVSVYGGFAILLLWLIIVIIICFIVIRKKKYSDETH